MNYTHYLLSFTEKTRKTTHQYCFFSLSEYIGTEDTILNEWIPGDTKNRYIFVIKNKIFDEGIFKISRNEAIWRIIEAFLKGFGATCIYAVDTIRIPVNSVKCGQKIYGDFYIEKINENPYFIYGTNT